MVLVMMTIAARRIRFMFFSLGLWDLTLTSYNVRIGR
jgi:hypothetical protein